MTPIHTARTAFTFDRAMRRTIIALAAEEPAALALDPAERE